MSVWATAGLALQTAALVIVHVAIRGQWLRHVGALFLAVAVLFHGVTEVMQVVWPDRNRYRALTSPDKVDVWMVWVSVAILTYAAVYAFAVQWLARMHPQVAEAPGQAHIAGLGLWWLVPGCVVLAALSFGGRGTLQSGTAGDTGSYLADGIVGQYLPVVMAAAGVVVLVRYGARWAMPVLCGQAVLLALNGARTVIIVTVLMTVVAAVSAGVVLPRRKVLAAAAVVAVLAVSISAARDAVGRESFGIGQDVAARVGALGTGVSTLGDGPGGSVLDDTVYRMDANTFGSLVLASVDDGAEPVGLVTAGNVVLLAVPRFLVPSKLTSSLEDRNEEVYFIHHFSLPYRDYLPGQFGTLVGYFGPFGMLLLAGLLAAAFAAAEWWLRRRASGVRTVLLLGLVQCALIYESGPTRYVITARSLLPLVGVVAFLAWRSRRKLARNAEPLDRKAVAWTG